MVATIAAAASACVRFGVCVGVLLLLLSRQAQGDDQTLPWGKNDRRPPANVAGDGHIRPLNALALANQDGISVAFERPIVINPRLVDHVSTRFAPQAMLGDATKADTPDFPAHGERELQAACSAGDPFTVSSAIFLDAEGCFTEVADDSSFYANAEGTWAILPVPATIHTITSSYSEYTSTTDTYWAVGLVFVDSNGDLVIDAECFSDDPYTTGSHPTDASSWSCQLGDFFYPVTGAGFSVDCGCSSDSPTGTGTGVTPAPTDVSGGTSECSGTDPFTVTSGSLPEFDGCYSDAGATGQTVFEQAAAGAGDSLAVREAYIDQAETDERWLVGTYNEDNSTDQPTVDCISQESSSEVHPANANWVCDFTGSGAYTVASDTQFSIECGCSSSSLPAISLAPTPAPVVDASAVTRAPVVDASAVTRAPVVDASKGTGATPSPVAGGPSSPIPEPIGAGGSGISGGAVRASTPSAIMMTGAALAVGLASGFVATKWRLY